MYKFYLSQLYEAVGLVPVERLSMRSLPPSKVRPGTKGVRETNVCPVAQPHVIDRDRRSSWHLGDDYADIWNHQAVALRGPVVTREVAPEQYSLTQALLNLCPLDGTSLYWTVASQLATTNVYLNPVLSALTAYGDRRRTRIGTTGGLRNTICRVC